MESLISLLLPFAGCAAMMFVCARMMRRDSCSNDQAVSDRAEIDELRAQVAELRAARAPSEG